MWSQFDSIKYFPLSFSKSQPLVVQTNKCHCSNPKFNFLWYFHSPAEMKTCGDTEVAFALLISAAPGLLLGIPKNLFRTEIYWATLLHKWAVSIKRIHLHSSKQRSANQVHPATTTTKNEHFWQFFLNYATNFVKVAIKIVFIIMDKTFIRII